jgi:hypothetical protein
LSWIAFRDPVLICRFEGRHGLLAYRRYDHPRSGNPERAMLDPGADQTLLDALKEGGLTAIRNGNEILSSYWYGKHTRHLTDDLRFRRRRNQALADRERRSGDDAGGVAAGAHQAQRGQPPSPSREKKFWPAAREAAVEWLADNGCPAPGDGNQAELERYVTDWLEDHGHQASESTVRRHVARWIKEYRDKLNG